MGDDLDLGKLSLEEKLTHKVWKARVSGYEELTKIHRQASSENSGEFSKYLGYFKKIVIDSNAVAQEKGLEATLTFVENAAPSISGRVAADVVGGCVLKCFNARPKTKDKGINIVLMYVEVEKQDIVQEELIKGLENKQPKIVTACTMVLRQIIREFGGKIFLLKPIVKTIPKLLEHSDKNVREEAKLLSIEIYKWIRDALRAQLQSIKPVQLKELDEEWAQLPPKPPAPTRLTRTQQKKLEEQQAQGLVPESSDGADGGGEGDGDDDEPADEAIDPYEMMDAVDLLSKLPKDFYENLEAKKWQLRKEALDALEKLASFPKHEGGQYGELLSALKKIISKDANVVVVAVAAKCVGFIATGLRKKFSSYATMIASAIFEKFKEKKVNVVTALRDAIDAVYLTTTLVALQEDILVMLDHKNPNVKEESIKFLIRCFCKATPAAVPKGFLKPTCALLVKRMDDTFGPVREATAEALGTLLKLLGEKVVNVYVDQLDKIKAEKVREYFEKVEIKGVPIKGGAGTASVSKPSAKPAGKPSSAAVAPSKAAPKKTGAKPAGGKGATKSGKSVKGAAKKKAGSGNKTGAPSAPEEVKEPEMTDDDVDAKAADLLPAEVLNQLGHANWKERFSGIETLTKLVDDMDPKTMECQVLIRVIGKKPGLKDNNFQVLKARLALCGTIAEKGKPFSSRSAGYALTGLVEKIGDIKLKDQCKETLTKFAEKLNLSYVSLKVAKLAGGQKNPKVIAESLNWMGDAVKDFGFKIELKPHIQFIKDSLANTNPAVRISAIGLLGVLHMYVGASIRMFFEEEKPALLQQIDAELEKVKDQKPPAPTRGLKPAADNEGEDDEDDDAEDGGGGGTVNLADLIPRNDISGEITAELIEMLGDKNWKVRAEGLQKVQSIIGAAKFITAELGDLSGALKARLGDSNKNLITITLGICASLATAMGPGAKKYLSTLGPAIFSTLADAKAPLRAAGIAALNAWHKEITLFPFVEGEVLFGALSTENPMLRTELLGWLEEKLPDEKTLPSLVTIVQPLYTCLEDRSGDVRKRAQAVIPCMMAHLGYDVMNKQTNKLKPASKPTVQAILEKFHGTVPEPTSTSSKPKKPAESKPTVDNGGGSKKVATTKTKLTTKPKKKADKAVEAEDLGPPLLHNLGKDNRIRDEKELKTMKWNFTTPREEFIDQLKEQMKGSISKSIMTNLFNLNDFKLQVNALNILQQAVTPPGDDEEPPFKTEAIQSLDLLLKYVTLRFFDTNTTVLVKCLEFLDALFTMLAESGYQMLDSEASSFIPYLINKVGDPKDVIRKMIRKLFKFLTKVYPASKMFTYVSEGLTSKNSKTRMECLEELGRLIQVYGMNVCQPSPPKAISNIASHIGCRDNGVRNAALNTVVEAYYLVGELVYKHAGRLNDKDLSYLEERIKRSSKNRPNTAAGSEEPKPVLKPRGAGDADKKQASKPVSRPVTAPPRDNITREFQIDYDVIEGERGDHEVFVPSLVSHESSVEDLISEPIHRPSTKTPSSPHLGVFSRTSAPAALNYVISQIASSDIQASTQALVQLEVVIRNKTGGEIVKHVDQFLNAAALQFNIILTTHLNNEEESEQNVTRLINCLINAMLTLFCNEPLAKTVSRDTLKHLAQVLITAILDERLAKLEDGPQIIRAINVLMAKIIQKTDPTVCLGALIRLLQESVKMLQGQVGNSLSSPKFMELVMKASWKMVRSLPTIIADIKVEQILLDVHKFLVAHPPQVWKERADDTPLRTIRTILHSLAKLKGIDILACTNLIEDSSQSEVTAYLHKVLKTGYKPSISSQMNGNQDDDNKKSIHSNTPDILQGVENPNRPPVAKLNSKLAEIFSKIASKENTREGLIQLYEFKLTYPQADIEPFLKKTSPYFQNYIDRGLRNIEMERKGKKISGSSLSASNILSSAPTTQTSEEPSSYLDRLRVLRMKSGLGGNNANTGTRQDSGGEAVQLTPTEESSNMDFKGSLVELRGSINTIEPEGPSSQDDQSNIQDIKKRLDRIKNAARQ